MRRGIVIAVLALETLGMCLTARAWRSEASFWQTATYDAPAAVAPRVNLAVALGLDGRLPASRAEAAEASRLLLTDDSPMIQRGAMAWNLVQLNRALAAPSAPSFRPTDGLIDEDRLWRASALASTWWQTRPLTRLTLRAQAWLGADVWAYRLVNLVLHLTVAVVLGVLIQSWMPAVAWALLPWHVETTVTLAGRGELLVGLGLLACCLAVRARRARWALVALAVAFASKESAVVALALVPLWATTTGLGWPLPVIGASLMTVLCLAHRLDARLAYIHVGLWAWAATQATAIWTLALRVFWPPVYMDGRAWPAWVSAVALSALGCVTAACVELRHRAPMLSLGLAWALLALLPRLLVSTPGSSLHARHLYVPSMGLAFALLSRRA